MVNHEGLEVVKKKLYVGCGLTLVPQSFKDEVEELKDELSNDWDVLQFLGTTAGTEIDVYRVDILENITECDCFVGIMDEPSWGLGWESREAALQHKPTLLVAHVASRITRLALATPYYFPGEISFRRYEDMVREVPGMVREEFAAVIGATEPTSS